MGNSCGCGANRMAQLSVSSRYFLTELNAKPNFARYMNKDDAVKTITKAMMSPIFGHSVMYPVGGPGKGVKRTKKNNLEDVIYAMKTDDLMGGGYYYLSNIRDGEESSICYDILMLVPNIKDKELSHKIKTIHDLSK